MTTYKGTLDIEPNEFSLVIEEMVVRNGVISFDYNGRWYRTRNAYCFSGTAMLQPEGHYKYDCTECVDDVEVESSIYIFTPKCSI